MRYAYKDGVEVVAEMGRMRPFGNRVLCRAIMRSDAFSSVLSVEYNSSEAECFEILAVGGGVARWCDENGEKMPLVGQHCDIRSTAADRVSQKDPTGRYWLVPVMDISAVWDPVDVDADTESAIARVKARSGAAFTLPKFNGEAILTPG
jgi:hypothetical protein